MKNLLFLFLLTPLALNAQTPFDDWEKVKIYEPWQSDSVSHLSSLFKTTITIPKLFKDAETRESAMRKAAKVHTNMIGGSCALLLINPSETDGNTQVSIAVFAPREKKFPNIDSLNRISGGSKKFKMVKKIESVPGPIEREITNAPIKFKDAQPTDYGILKVWANIPQMTHDEFLLTRITNKYLIIYSTKINTAIILEPITD